LLIDDSDLLSKFSIFDVVNNWNNFLRNTTKVVICFQNFRSLMSWTTWSKSSVTRGSLWFAFKIFDLWCREQQLVSAPTVQFRCDLLSKFSIFDVVNNCSLCTPKSWRVVICFQNFRSLMSWTTSERERVRLKRLWFAFKIFDLWCREQQDMGRLIGNGGCDLLSKFSIFDVVNNRKQIWTIKRTVVICFQNFRSLMSWTTIFIILSFSCKLWFAFKIFDLWCREQRRSWHLASQRSCDLLSKFSIFDVVNNSVDEKMNTGRVVICFQNFRSLMSWTTFLVLLIHLLSVVICFQNFRSLMSWTTTFKIGGIEFTLWFAFKIFDLWCREQPFWCF